MDIHCNALSSLDSVLNVPRASSSEEFLLAWVFFNILGLEVQCLLMYVLGLVRPTERAYSAYNQEPFSIDSI